MRLGIAVIIIISKSYVTRVIPVVIFFSKYRHLIVDRKPNQKESKRRVL